MSGACKCVDYPVHFAVKTAKLYENKGFSRGLVIVFQHSYLQ
jgi:hypothetical protein